MKQKADWAKWRQDELPLKVLRDVGCIDFLCQNLAMEMSQHSNYKTFKLLLRLKSVYLWFCFSNVSRDSHSISITAKRSWLRTKGHERGNYYLRCLIFLMTATALKLSTLAFLLLIHGMPESNADLQKWDCVPASSRRIQCHWIRLNQKTFNWMLTSKEVNLYKYTSLGAASRIRCGLAVGPSSVECF